MMKIDSSAWQFFLPLLAASVMCIGFGWEFIGAAFLIVALWVLFFFRDPERIPPDVRGALVSPADGKVDTLEIVDHPAFPNRKAKKIGIFLSIFDVHINRAPFSGRIVSTKHQPGRFLNAMNKDSSTVNESNTIALETRAGPILVKQIAGVIARRIVCSIKKDDIVQCGDRIGLICFGSRTEAFVPVETIVKVKPGMRVKGGSTLLGIIPPESE